jgi:hypothetical protein
MEMMGTGRLYHPALGQDVRYEVREVPEGGDAQTEMVIGMMRGYVVEDAGSEEIRGDVEMALAESPGLNPAEAVFWFVKRRLRFVKDESTAVPFQEGMGQGDVVVETLIRPRDMSTLCGDRGSGAGTCMRQGDCDDFSMYTACLLTAAGVPAAFVTVAADSRTTDYSHVYVAAYPDGGGRVALDTSHGSVPGWETDKAQRVREWPVSRGGVGELVGLSILVLGALALCRW